jgi:hypothetical protein
MTARSSRYVALMLGFCFSLGVGSTRASEKIPNDKIIHPLMKGVVEPELIPESRKEPAYPEPWRKLHLGARVFLQAVVKKSGTVREITPLKTDLWVENACGRESGNSTGKGSEDQGMLEPGASKEKIPGKQAAPPEAVHEFEVAATNAVKQWRYRPGEKDDVRVDVYTTIIVEFTSCPKEPEKQAP